jgi:hypothetical protein
MDTATAAQTAGVTVATIRAWCRRNVIAAVKTAGRWIIDTASLAYRVTLGGRKEKRVEITTETVVAIGGSRWQRGDKDRVYINDWALFIGLEVDRYKSGNISSASLDGETISNSEAYRLLTAVYKVYFDAADSKLHIQWGDSSPRSMDRDDLAKAIFGGIRAAIAAL